MRSHKLTQEKAIQFIFGGNSTFTCKNTESGNRFTFRVKKHKTDDIYFVSVLTNPDTYTFVGSIKKTTQYKHSIKSKIGVQSQSVQVFDYIIKALRLNKLSEKVEIWHEGKCGMCGRTLTVPESIETGFGPFCQSKLNQ